MGVRRVLVRSMIGLTSQAPRTTLLCHPSPHHITPPKSCPSVDFSLRPAEFAGTGASFPDKEVAPPFFFGPHSDPTDRHDPKAARGPAIEPRVGRDRARLQWAAHGVAASPFAGLRPECTHRRALAHTDSVVGHQVFRVVAGRSSATG